MSNQVYAIVTERILQLLEQGTVPWRRTWTARDHAPRNIDGRRYTGINVWLLVTQAQAQGYSDPRWLTFNQAKQHGGSVRKGEKASMVVFWKILDQVETDPATGETTTKHIPLLRYYNVFNLEQCEGVKVRALPIPEPNGAPVEIAERVIAEMPNRPRIFHGDTRAYYRPLTDSIHLPNPGDFESLDAYYATAFHELGHSTGHRSRLNREGIGENAQPFGSHAYGREELVAEMTAAYLCAEADIENRTINNAASYLAGWIAAIKEDVRAVVVAASRAQHAADYILGRQAIAAASEPIAGEVAA